jgi:hypothetical protein
MTRRLFLVPMAVAALVLVGCSDDGGDDVATGTEPVESTEPGPTGSAPVEDTTCADLDVAVIDQVEDPGPDDGRPEDAGPTAEEIRAIEQAAAALHRVAAAGPDELREDASTVADAYDIALELTGEVEPVFHDAAQRLLTWGVASCEVDGPIWSCTTRGTFRIMGAPIPGTEGPPSTPEDALASVDIDPAWERVEVERTDDRVTFAWLDADGLAVYSATAEAGAGTWRQDQSTSCDSGEWLPVPDESVGEPPLAEDDLPPASSSVPTG